MSAVTLLDGPVGSELERRGLALPLPEWTAQAVAQRPDLLAAVHADWAAAGASVHTAATFRTTARALAGTSLHGRWRQLAHSAVAVCRQAVGPRAQVAGSLAPLEDCYAPERTPDDAALAREHAALAEVLTAAGCDLLLVETMPTRRELVAAVRAAAACGLPVWAAVTFGPEGRWFAGDELRRAADEAQRAGASAFLLNCSDPATITARLGELAPREGLRLGAYGNAIFDRGGLWTPTRYAREARRWEAAGATILGGCCGTRPEHLRAVTTATT